MPERSRVTVSIVVTASYSAVESSTRRTPTRPAAARLEGDLEDALRRLERARRARMSTSTVWVKPGWSKSRPPPAYFQRTSNVKRSTASRSDRPSRRWRTMTTATIMGGTERRPTDVGEEVANSSSGKSAGTPGGAGHGWSRAGPSERRLGRVSEDVCLAGCGSLRHRSALRSHRQLLRVHGRVRAGLRARGIALLALPPRSPKLHGAVERANRTHTEEFYEVTDAEPELEAFQAELRAWETVYNTIRPHQALGYLTPAEYLASIGRDVYRTY